jgi:Concanavalin A-like lectin/glucanases superfamily
MATFLIAAPLLIAAVVMAVRFVGCSFDPGGPGFAPGSYGFAVLDTANLVSFWALNDPSGSTTAYDSNHANTGTYHGGVILHVPGLLSPESEDSTVYDVNFAAEFDGMTGYVSVPFANNLNPNQKFSVQALVQPLVIDQNLHVIVSSTNGATGYLLALNNSDFEAGVGTGTEFKTVAVHANAQPNQSYYLAMTYDGTNLELYVNPAPTEQDSNGNFDKTEFVNADPNHESYNTAQYPYEAQTTNELRIGADTGGGQPGEFFAGVIQDVAVYNAALSFQDIAFDYWIYETGYALEGQPGRPVLSGSGALSVTAAFPPNNPTTEPYTVAGPYTYPIPYWCTYIDLFLLGAGGGGSVSFAGGNGGQGGSWQAKTLQRGVEIPWMAASISITVGLHGSGGSLVPATAPSSGGNTTATYATGTTTTTTQTAVGGGGGANPNPDGASPNPLSQTLNGTTEMGGTVQTTPGAPGNPQGGGGAGGVITGGAGADGAAWVVARQT